MRDTRHNTLTLFTVPLRIVAGEYIVLLDAVLETHGRAGHGWEGFYLGENGHVSFYEIGRAIGDALVEMELADNAEPTPLTDAELANCGESVVSPGLFSLSSSTEVRGRQGAPLVKHPVAGPRGPGH